MSCKPGRRDGVRRRAELSAMLDQVELVREVARVRDTLSPELADLLDQVTGSVRAKLGELA